MQHFSYSHSSASAHGGGTLITLKADGNTEVAQVPFTRNLYQETLAERGLAE